jgi:hypothetical protein
MTPEWSVPLSLFNIVNEDILNELKLEILSHLTSLSQSFDNNFPVQKFETVKKSLWIKNPFDFESPESIIELNFDPEEEAKFQHLISSFTLKNDFQQLNLSSFWIMVKCELSLLSSIEQSLRLIYYYICT